MEKLAGFEFLKKKVRSYAFEDSLTSWMEDYFSGKVVGNLPFWLVERIYPGSLSKFQRKVYRALLDCAPYGFTLTYSFLARKVRSHPRAVASAMRANRLPVVIPCHRVVAKNSLGGYSYGIDVKEKLIQFERENLYNSPSFFVDSMLGDLAKFLRMLGFSVKVPRKAEEDSSILMRSVREGRLVVTMDESFPPLKNVLNLASVPEVHSGSLGFVECKNSVGIEKRFLCFLRTFRDRMGKPLRLDLSRFMSRCSVCDNPTMFFPSESIPDFIEEKFRLTVPECVREVLKPRIFAFCPSCERFYWVGSHVDNFFKNTLVPVIERALSMGYAVVLESECTSVALR